MRLRKAFLTLALLCSAVACRAGMVITNAPKTASGGGGSGNIVKIQSTGGRAGGTNLALSLTNVEANRLITMQGGGGSAAAPTDNKGHTFTGIKVQPGPSESAWVYYYITTAAYSGTYTVTKAAGGIAITASVAEWQSTLDAFTVDISTGKTGGASTTYETGASATTDANSSLAIAAVITNSGSNSAITGPSEWGELFTESDGGSWLAGASHFSTASVSGGSLNPQWTDGNFSYGAVLAVIK